MENKNNQNDPEVKSFVSLITKYQPQIYSYIFSIVPNISDADDILQETTKLMWERYGQFVKGSNFRAWAITIAHYRVLEYIRAKKKNNKIHFSETLVELIHDDMEKKTDYTKEYLSHLKDCIKKLSLKDKDMIILKYYRSLKAEELSLRFKKSVRTIYLNLSRIQRQLLKCIKRGMAVEKA